MIRIVLGSDHAGFILKEHIKKYLITDKYEVYDNRCSFNIKMYQWLKTIPRNLKILFELNKK